MKELSITPTWDPFRELEDLSSRLASGFGRSLWRREGKDNLAMAEWAPVVDITEDKKEYLINAELPGVKKEDVKVTVEHGMLTIRGERKFEHEEKEEKAHRIERAYGSFMRSFSVPDDADAGKIDAEFKDGMLKIRLPKSETAKPKQIDIKVS